MKVVVEGTVATLYDDEKNPVLRISTKDDVLTTEVLDIKVINDVVISQVADVIDGDYVGVVVEEFSAPGVVVEREIKP
jgi:hypothetical protein